jgi:trimeric autotransporter adhesin
MKYGSIKSRLSLIAAIGSLALAAVAQQTSSVASSASSGTSNAVVPQLVNYSGVLTDVNGKPLSGVVGVTFALYRDSEGGTPLWMEIQNVQPTKGGHYTVMLGSTSNTGLPQDVFVNGEARWLGVRAEGQAEAPRVLLVAVPYALKAGDAETIGGLPASAFMLANGTSGTTAGTKSAAAAASSGGSKNSAPPANPAVTGKGTVNYIPMWDTASDIVDSLIFQKGSGIGIGTTAPGATLDVSGKADVRDTLTLFPKSTDNTLAVSGTAFNISSLGKVTFVTGQTFPGAGTLTGITTAAGSGLSGGGTTGTLSLKVPAAGITNAMLADSKVTLNASTAGGLTAPGAMTLGSTYTIGLKTCTANQVLQYNGTVWGCASAGTGTVTSVGSGSGLAGGPITGSGSLSIATAGVSNAMLANSSLTISPGTSLTGGGKVALGGSTTLSLDTTKVPLLAAANTFTGNQTVNGTVTASSFSGNGSALTNVTSTNSSELGGLGSSAYAQLAAANTFSNNQTVNGTLTASSPYITINSTSTATNAAALEGNGEYNGVLGFAASTTGINYGVAGETQSTSGIGVGGYAFGTAGITYGLYGSSVSASGLGVYGTSPYVGVEGYSPASSNNSFAVYGLNASPTGYGVFGFSPYVGTYGVAVDDSFEGLGFANAGVWGDTGSTTAGFAGVLGTADNNYGGLFLNESVFYPAIYAENDDPNSGGEAFHAYVAAVDTFAIIGDPGCNTGFIALELGQNSMNACVNYTLAGGTNGDTYINASPGGAVHMRINSVEQLVATSGNVSVYGSFSATGTKNFRIDDPLDPANKYLFHASIESSEVLNLYSGNAVLDASGEAVVQLPDWFEVINKDFRYQLTPVGAPGRGLYVAEEVSGGHFKIAGGLPSGKVSWQVSGVRNDAWEKAHPMEVEADKGTDRGHYLTPELYGAPETARIGYMAPAPGNEQIVRPRPSMLKRGNVSPLQHRTGANIAVPPPMPVAPKLPPMPHPTPPAGKLAVSQK